MFLQDASQRTLLPRYKLGQPKMTACCPIRPAAALPSFSNVVVTAFSTHTASPKYGVIAAAATAEFGTIASLDLADGASAVYDALANSPPTLQPASNPVHGSVSANIGRVELIVGPMFAGKSTELLKRVRDLRDRGEAVIVVKPCKDDRYSSSAVATHNGDSEPCLTLRYLWEIPIFLSASAYSSTSVIAVDEGQFFPDLFEYVQQAADRHCKTVLVAGLDGDFLRSRFGQVLDLVPLADTVTKLAAKCRVCAEQGLDVDAPFSERTSNEQAQEMVGGADLYRPVCRRHYLRKPTVLVEKQP